MALTIGGLFTEARRILNDDDAVRYTDADLAAAFNDALLQTRAKRPDAFLALGLRVPVPQFAMPDDQDTAFPISEVFYPAFLFYCVGRSEIKEDTFTNQDRAVVLMNKFASQLLTVQS
jgi:hypothetical protein